MPAAEHPPPTAQRVEPAPQRQRYAFFTLPNYTFIALSSAIETLRMANRVLARDAYGWTIVSERGEPVVASNGLSLSPTLPVEDMGAPNIVFVCGGVDVRKSVTPSVLATLRRLAQHRVALGSLCTGGYVLARAGLLEKCRAVIHWEDLPALREEFPQVEICEQIYAIDRDRYTSSGGIAPMDMMLHIIRDQHGPVVAQAICEQFIVERMRDDRDRQRVPLQAKVGVFHHHLIHAAELMEANIEAPLSLDDVADKVGVSRRQIERLFRRHLGMVPSKYYLEARLKRARALLLQTHLSIMEVAVACGFESPPHFSRCYRSQFGCTPSAERQRKDARCAVAA
ncbi:MAG TPA: GlxA family transcriptional regulator [Burkholderiaceae bacterium]|nr:GlxA family transcriptional regulator [Burkholderiaceae bacterium]